MNQSDRRGRVRQAGNPFGYGAAGGGGEARPSAPSLSAATAGSPTSDGTVGAGVTTSQGTGRLYWAVVTNAGSCTDAQLKAGSGGNIVAGKAGNQVVGSAAAQTIPTITGLTTATTYQIKFLQSNGDGKDSAQASATLVTL